LQGLKNQQVDINFLGLIALLALVSGNCDVGTPTLNHFDWSKVVVIVFTCLLEQANVKTALCFYISFLVQLKSCTFE